MFTIGPARWGINCSDAPASKDKENYSILKLGGAGGAQAVTSIAFYCQRQVGHKLFHVPSEIEKKRNCMRGFRTRVVFVLIVVICHYTHIPRHGKGPES